MPHAFLSEEWMTAARAIRTKYGGRATKITQVIKMNQIVTGVPFGNGTIRSFLDTSSGQVVMDLGVLPDAEVTVTTDYDTARKIFLERDPAASMQAFISGLIKVQGDIVMMMTLQTALPDDEIAKIVMQEILDITS